MIFTFDIELWFKVTTCSPFTNKLMSQIGDELDPGPRNSTSFKQRHSVVDIWARLGQVERKYASDKFCQTGGTHKWMEG